MLTRRDEYFVRIVLLLLRGAHFSSKKKIITEVNKVHVDLDKILLTFKTHLKHIFLHKYYIKLFPSSGKTDIETWDLAMLTKVLLNVFEIALTEDEKGAVENIKSIRDEMFAHAHSSTLSSDEYNEYQQKLVDAIKILCSQFDQDDIDECDKIIAACKNDEIDESHKLDMQRQLLATEALVQEVISKQIESENKICNHVTETLESAQKGIRQDVRQDVRQVVMEELAKFHSQEDRSQKIVRVIDSELTLSAPVNEGEQVNLAEEIITTVINEAIDEVGDANDHPKIRSAVKKILSDIKKIPDVQIGTAKHKCIILGFRCTSYKAVLDLLLYIESQTFNVRLDKLANAVSEDIFDNAFGCKLHVAVATECLTTLLHELRADSSQHRQTIKLPIELKTVKGLENIWNIFEGDCALEHFNELSDAIFEDLNTRITVTPSLNLQQVADALKISDEQSRTSTAECEEVIENAFAAEQFQSEIRENDTNEIYRHLREVKSRSIKQPSDSGYGSDAVSSITGRSNTSEGYAESTEGGFEPIIGTSVDIAPKDEINITSSTVGPVVMLNGYEDKCFITTGDSPSDIDDFTVNGQKETLTVLAHNRNDSTIMIASVDSNLFIDPQIEEVNKSTVSCTIDEQEELRGQRVVKFGAKTGLTEGIIAGIEEAILGGPESTPQKVLLVGSLADSTEECFAKNGDAGALVIHQDSTGSWTYVGVLLGSKHTFGSEELFIVKPIKDILKDFQSLTGMPVVIDKKYMDRHVSKLLEKAKM